MPRAKPGSATTNCSPRAAACSGSRVDAFMLHLVGLLGLSGTVGRRRWRQAGGVVAGGVVIATRGIGRRRPPRRGVGPARRRGGRSPRSRTRPWPGRWRWTQRGARRAPPCSQAAEDGVAGLGGGREGRGRWSAALLELTGESGEDPHHRRRVPVHLGLGRVPADLDLALVAVAQQVAERGLQQGGVGTVQGGERRAALAPGASRPQQHRDDHAHPDPQDNVLHPDQSQPPALRLEQVEQDDHNQRERCLADQERDGGRHVGGQEGHDRQRDPQRHRAGADGEGEHGRDHEPDHRAADGEQGGSAHAQRVGAKHRQGSQHQPEAVLHAGDPGEQDRQPKRERGPQAVAEPDAGRAQVRPERGGPLDQATARPRGEATANVAAATVRRRRRDRPPRRRRRRRPARRGRAGAAGRRHPTPPAPTRPGRPPVGGRRPNGPARPGRPIGPGQWRSSPAVPPRRSARPRWPPGPL